MRDSVTSLKEILKGPEQFPMGFARFRLPKERQHRRLVADLTADIA
jgi:hypothetical protein